MDAFEKSNRGGQNEQKRIHEGKIIKHFCKLRGKLKEKENVTKTVKKNIFLQLKKHVDDASEEYGGFNEDDD